MKEAGNAVQRVLVVSALSGAKNCATAIMQQMGLDVDVVPGRREALEVLRTRSYAALVVDDALAESDPRGAEMLWKLAGLAIPMQVNFALTGTIRLVRDLRAALGRREQEQDAAQQAALRAIESELRDTISGLLLHAQLALRDSPPSAQLEQRLRLMVELAGNLKQKLDVPQA